MKNLFKSVLATLAALLPSLGNAAVVMDLDPPGGPAVTFFSGPGTIYTALTFNVQVLPECQYNYGYTDFGNLYGGYAIWGCGNSAESARAAAITAMELKLTIAGIGSPSGLAYIGLRYGNVEGKIKSGAFGTNINIPRIPPEGPDKNDKCSADAVAVDGDPIVVATGSGIQNESLFAPLAVEPLLGLNISYQSGASGGGNFGAKWTSTYSAKLYAASGVSGTQLTQTTYEAGQISKIVAVRDDGTTFVFTRASNGVLTSDAGWKAALSYSAGVFTLIDLEINVIDQYSAAGVLIGRYRPFGGNALIARAANSMTISSSTGRTIVLQIGAAGTVVSATDSAGNQISAGYEGSLVKVLNSISFPDTGAKSFTYSSTTFPTALTGIVDQLGKTYASWTYDSTGRTISSSNGNGVNSFSFDYGSATSPTVTNPLGSTNQYTFTSLNGRALTTSKSQPAGSGCAAATSTATFDAVGNFVSKNDFNGHRACYVNDQSRHLVTVEVAGLAGTQVCTSVIGDGVALPVGSKKTSIQWHPDWRLRTRVAGSGQIITNVYNGQVDPFTGLVASCAPAAATLPGGKPIVVLCKRVEQPTTDTDGHLGFSALPQAGVADRVSTWTYDQAGRTLTAKGSRTDVNDLTSYTYYTDTTLDHMIGDLASTTNALGQVTQYSKYNRYGQVLESTDPNLITTVNTYDSRQRLLSSSTNGETTSYSYDLAGQLKRVTRQDASYLEYEYDEAHRQKAIKDHIGNRIDYLLDNSGNRILEETRDSTGNLTRTISRTFDALGRVQQVTGTE